MLPEGRDRRELGVFAAARDRQLPSAAGACPVGQIALRTEGKPHFPVSKPTRDVKAKQQIVSLKRRFSKSHLATTSQLGNFLKLRELLPTLVFGAMLVVHRGFVCSFPSCRPANLQNILAN